MSDSNTTTTRKNNTRFALLAGILAMGILAAALTSSQALSATAQTGSGVQDDDGRKFRAITTLASLRSLPPARPRLM